MLIRGSFFTHACLRHARERSNTNGRMSVPIHGSRRDRGGTIGPFRAVLPGRNSTILIALPESITFNLKL
eukprot:2620408-Amphidinium_carterae.1